MIEEKLGFMHVGKLLQTNWPQTQLAEKEKLLQYNIIVYCS